MTTAPPSARPTSSAGTRVLAVVGIGLALIGIACLLRDARLGTPTLRIGLISIASSLLIIGLYVCLEYRRAPESFPRIFTSRASAAVLFQNLSPWPLPPEGHALIGLNESYAKRVRRALWLSYGVVAVFVAAAPLLGVGVEGVHITKCQIIAQRLVNVLFGSGVLVILCQVAVLTILARRGLKHRIGTDGTSLLFDAGDGVLQRHEWSSVLTDRRSLLVGHRTIWLIPPGGRPETGTFPTEPLRGYVLARLPAASYVTPARFAWTALCRTNLKTRLLYGAAVAMFAAVEFLKMRPDLARPLQKVFADWLTR